MNVHGIRHDLRRNKRIDELLHDDGKSQGEKGRPRIDEQPDKRRYDTADPRADDGDNIHDARDKPKRSGVRDADEVKPDSARKTDEKALEKRGLQVTAHDAREGEMKHFGFLLAIIGNEAPCFPTNRRQLHEHPERHDKRKTYDHQGISNTRADNEDAVRRKPRRSRRPISQGLCRRIQPIAHRFVLKDRGVLAVQMVSPLYKRLGIARQTGEHVGELLGDSRSRRKHSGQKHCRNRTHAQIRNGRSDNARHTERFKLCNGGPQTQHEDDRPCHNGHRHGQDIEHATEQIHQKRNADEHPDNIETAARVIAALRTRLALVRHTNPARPYSCLEP